MKPTSLLKLLPRFRSQRSGSALLLILGCVALLTIVILAFFSNARTESSTSSFYARGANTKLLTENVINLVEAQLREGARSIDLQSGLPVAWASQPGMIRTYGTNGMPYRYFKLYSWSNMVGSLSGGQTFDETVPGETPPIGSSGWATQPNVYGDLNEPVNGIYPVIDPAASGKVEGFSYTSGGLSSGSSNTLPMPVKWLYVLRDGTTSVGVSAGVGTKVTISGASAANPVVGRVAFWTDDETCKININTASEGTFWDIPYGQSSEELGIPGSSTTLGFAMSYPSQFEFQRIPGHPATTSLSTVFGFSSSPMPDTSVSNTSWPLTTSSYGLTFAPYYTVTPRYTAGGSMGGAQQGQAVLNAPAYRLFDSVDELAFDPTRIPITSNPSGTPPLYTAANGSSPTGRLPLAITPQVIEQRRFFLSAHSRAPEETLFGTPRVSLWPLQTDIAARTAKDNLLAFCSTIGGQPYYYQRAQWYQYQKTGTSSATQSATPSSQSTTADFPAPPTPPGATTSKTGIDRNEDIYGYLQALTGKQIPGFGGDFFDKYPGGPNSAGTNVSDRDQILTEMFDLLRSGVNTFTTQAYVYPHYTVSPFSAGGGTVQNGGSGSSYPISIPSNNTHGIGRTYNISEVSLVFMASAIDVAPSTAPAGTLETPGSSYVPLNPVGNPIAIPPTYSHLAYPRRISIGPGLPWANEIDYLDPSTGAGAPGTLPKFLCWKTSSNGSYKTYTIPDASNPPGTLTAPLPPGAGYVAIGDPQTTAVTAFLLLKPVTVMPGAPAFAPNIRVRITNLDRMTLGFPAEFSGSTYSQNLGFPSAANAVAVCSFPNVYGASGESTPDGGMLALDFPGLQGGPATPPINPPPWFNNGGSLTGTSQYPYPYPFVGLPVKITNGTLNYASYPSPFGGEDPEQPSGVLAEDPSVVSPPPAVPIHMTTYKGTANWFYPGGTMVLNPGGGIYLKIEVLGGVDPNNPQIPDGSTPVLSTNYVYIPTMTLPIPTVEMANGTYYGGTEPFACGLAQNNSAGYRIPGYGGNPDSTPPLTGTGVGIPTTPPNTNSYTLSPLDYYWQIPETVDGKPTNPLNIISRFSATGSAINRGDVVRSFDVNPNSHIEGDMRLLAADPNQDPGSANGTNNDLFTLLGSARDPSVKVGDSTYKNLYSQGPSNNPWIKQLHSIYMNYGDGIGALNLIQTSSDMLTGVKDPTTVAANNLELSGGNVVLTPIGVPPMNFPGMWETNGALFRDPALANNPSLGPTIDGLEHYGATSAPDVTPELEGAYMDVGTNLYPGDWTLGQGCLADGPFVLKPDEGLQVASSGTYSILNYQTNLGNLDLGSAASETVISFSPNRQVPSGIIFGTLASRPFGSLPGQGQKGVPWCTLLFCPNPASNDAGVPHPGFGVGAGASPGPTDYPPYSTPPDHLLLDNFWMPVVEPYAISEPFSTAGKVNMNYAMVPFGEYIRRTTALHAVLKSTRIIAVPTIANEGLNGNGFNQPGSTTAAYRSYNPSIKSPWSGNVGYSSGSGFDFSIRYGINLTLTIDDTNSQFYARLYTMRDLFRSASEICNVFLVPQKLTHTTGATLYYGDPGSLAGTKGSLPALPTDASYSSMTSWWKNFKLTGDNGRESPYNQIYPRLTTKSDSYQVHMRVQVLTQTSADVATGTFDSAAGDTVSGEYRGSAILERYVDPNQTGLPDFATAFPSDATQTLDAYVRYRVVSTHAFSP